MTSLKPAPSNIKKFNFSDLSHILAALSCCGIKNLPDFVRTISVIPDERRVFPDERKRGYGL